MSPQVTFKSNEEKAPRADAAEAPRLCDAVRSPFAASHGMAPSRMPPAPTGLEDLGPGAAIRVVGPDREKWLQGMQSNDLSAAPFGGAIAAAFLGGKGRLIALGMLWRRRDEVIVTTDPGRLDALRAHLDKLLIMEDCEMQEAPGLRRLRFWPGDVPPRQVPSHISGSPQPLGFELLLPEEEAQSLLETLRDRPAALYDVLVVTSQEDAQTPETATRWAQSNIGLRYLFVVDALETMYDHGILTEKVDKRFFRYLNLNLWDRYLTFFLNDYLDSKTLWTEDAWNRVMRFGQFLKDEEAARELMQIAEAARGMTTLSCYMAKNLDILHGQLDEIRQKSATSVYPYTYCEARP